MLRVTALVNCLVAVSAFFSPSARITSPTASVLRRNLAPVSMAAVQKKMQWVPFVNAAECQKGTINSGFQYGLEIAIVCDEQGGLYAMSNKMPPFGQPTTFALQEKGVVIDPVTRTQFSTKTGKPVGSWCPAPPLFGKLFGLITSPQDMPTFPCRKKGNAVEVNVNVNAKAAFETDYWRGILDAQGKTDGGYY
mmetsp:Transcript_17937/g.29932  ORF Transcript_17937/g.29932 Transcript_17937/m.29932 type:complete len:193 (-) Transcript_17937:241-819(-)